MPEHFADDAREVAAAFAHELNQPLGSVANLLRGMRCRVASGRIEPEEIHEMLGRAIRLNSFAADVVKGMREFVTARRPHREVLELASLAGDSLALLESEVRHHDIVVQVPPAQPRALIRGNRTMLIQVFVNLIRNAIEALAEQPRQGRRLRIEVCRHGQAWHVGVADSGKGVAEGENPFAPFVTGKAGAIGVGLNISRSIVERHGGSLWYEQNRDGGLTFWAALAAEEDRRTES